jgi:hypothetical protein
MIVVIIIIVVLISSSCSFLISVGGGGGIFYFWDELFGKEEEYEEEEEEYEEEDENEEAPVPEEVPSGYKKIRSTGKNSESNPFVMFCKDNTYITRLTGNETSERINSIGFECSDNKIVKPTGKTEGDSINIYHSKGLESISFNSGDYIQGLNTSNGTAGGSGFATNTMKCKYGEKIVGLYGTGIIDSIGIFCNKIV